jgi:hypothetical protein
MITKFSPRYIIANRACKTIEQLKLLSFMSSARHHVPIPLYNILSSELALHEKIHWLVYHAFDTGELNRFLSVMLLNWAKTLDKDTAFQKIALMLWDGEIELVQNVLSRQIADTGSIIYVELGMYCVYSLTVNKPSATVMMVIEEILKQLHNTNGEIVVYNLIEQIALTEKIPTFIKLLGLYQG